MKRIFVSVLLLAVWGCEEHSPLKKWNDPPQEMSDEEPPQTMVIILDGSGSMDGQKIVDAKRAIRLYLHSLPADVLVGMVAFHRYQIEVIADIGEDKETIINKMISIRTGGGTPLSTAVSKGHEMLWKRAQSEEFRGNYYLVIVTDGEADSEYALSRNVEEVVGNTPIQIFTIGLDIGEGHSLNTPGPQMRYLAVDDEAGIARGLGQVLLEAYDPVVPSP